jgi:uncharacterized protein
MYYPRMLKSRWLELSKQFPVLLLTGPRQVGKTTFLQHVAGKNRRYVTLDDPDLRLLAREDPSLFFQRHTPPILIDEIQYAPDLMQYIKMQVDAKKQTGMFWLTGSQQFQMMKGISETLAGRVGIINMLGFSSRERYKLKLDVEPFIPAIDSLTQRESSRPKTSVMNLYKDIWKGSYPALIAGPAKDREVFYSSYLQTYLQRDVRELTQVADESAFLKFLKACATRTGQLLNMSELARDADVSVGTAKNWLSILQASFQIFLLQPYYSNLTKRLVKRPKLYFLDTGLCAYLTDWTSPKTLESGAMSGAILETYVLLEILKSWWHQGRTPSLYYYRDKDCREIDFVFVQDQALYPLEVKKSASPKSRWTESFPALKYLNIDIKAGVVACLCKETLPLGKRHFAIPINLI